MAISYQGGQIKSLSADEFISRGKTMADINQLVGQGVLAPTQGGQGEYTVNDLATVQSFIGNIPSSAGATELPSGEKIGTTLGGGQAPVTTSALARSELGVDLDNQVNGLQLEMPSNDNQLLDEGKRALESQKRTEEDMIRRNSEAIGSQQEVLVEGRHVSLGQWIGRTSQNRTLNFTHTEDNNEGLLGKYVPVLVTRAGPNSLAGESLTSGVL